jgi:hypothetical protein
MGNFYTNFTIVGGNSNELLRVAKDLGRTAFVISDEKGDALLFDADCDEQNVAEIERLGGELAKRLSQPVLASMNHDDDHLFLWIFQADRIYRYESCFQAFAFGWSLARVRGGFLSYPFIVAVLAWPLFIVQVFRHVLLMKFVGFSPISAGFGYTYLARG